MKLQLLGWDISRQVLGFVEDGSRVLGDIELLAVMHVLGETPTVLEDFFQDLWASRKKT